MVWYFMILYYDAVYLYHMILYGLYLLYFALYYSRWHFILLWSVQFHFMYVHPRLKSLQADAGRKGTGFAGWDAGTAAFAGGSPSCSSSGREGGFRVYGLRAWSLSGFLPSRFSYFKAWKGFALTRVWKGSPTGLWWARGVVLQRACLT